MVLKQAAYQHRKVRYSTIALMGLAGIICLPILALIALAVLGSFDGFLHISKTVLPDAGATTLQLMIGVGFLTAVIGTGTAWLVSHFKFPLRTFFQWGLMLPLAVPTYISGYTFVEFFSYTGPIQETLRAIGGFQTAREYWFPEIRSVWGAVFVFSFVLYPYVYLSVRTLFLLQSSHIPDSARMLGASGSRLFWKITVPLMRPAIMLGVTLALMETINDIGAVEYLGVNTLTFSVFSVWLNQSDLSGAIHIALFLLVIVFGLIYFEHLLRSSKKYHDRRHDTSKKKHQEFGSLSTGTSWGVSFIVAIPILIGFGIPLYVLTKSILGDPAQWSNSDLIEAFSTTIFLGAIAAIVAVIVGLMIAFLVRSNDSHFARVLVRVSTIGYAVPGTIIAIGVLIPLAGFDNSFDQFMRATFGISTGLLLTGSGAALIFAYVVRFMAMAEGNIENGFAKLSPNLDMAGRTLGRTRFKVLREILLPILSPAILSAGLLVFVDVVKELSATILLRPFGTDTLATFVYDYASQGRVEESAVACLLIIITGIVPVMLLARQR